MSPRSTTAGYQPKDVSLQVREGEILGIAGIAGNGQASWRKSSQACACEGQVFINGENVANRSPKPPSSKAQRTSPEDRTGVGTAPNLAITSNLIMKTMIAHRSVRIGISVTRLHRNTLRI